MCAKEEREKKKILINNIPKDFKCESIIKKKKRSIRAFKKKNNPCKPCCNRMEQPGMTSGTALSRPAPPVLLSPGWRRAERARLCCQGPAKEPFPAASPRLCRSQDSSGDRTQTKTCPAFTDLWFPHREHPSGFGPEWSCGGVKPGPAGLPESCGSTLKVF